MKVQEELKRKREGTDINWSEFIRQSIQHKIQLGERRKTGEKLLKHLAAKRHVVPKGFINKNIRELREIR